MERLTISLDDDLAKQFDAFLQQKGYRNRSEAMRDLIREKLESERLSANDAGEKDCIGTLTYIYNHHERELSSRLAKVQHDHHSLSISTLHVHLDHDHCMEVMALRGPVKRVQHFSDSVIATPGVRHGQYYLVPVAIEKSTAASTSDHIHTKPKT